MSNKNNKEAKNNKTNGEEQKLIEENISLSKKEHDELKAKADERDAYCDKYIRAHAEFENAKR